MKKNTLLLTFVIVSLVVIGLGDPTVSAMPAQDVPVPVYYPGDVLKTVDSPAFTGQSTYDLGLPCPDAVYQATDAQGRQMLRCVVEQADPTPDWQTWKANLTPARQMRITAVCPDDTCWHAYFVEDMPAGFDWNTTWVVIGMDYGNYDSGPIEIKWAAWCNWTYVQGAPVGTQDYCHTGTISMQRNLFGSQYDVWAVNPQRIQHNDGLWYPWYGSDILWIEPIW